MMIESKEYLDTIAHLVGLAKQLPNGCLNGAVQCAANEIANRVNNDGISMQVTWLISNQGVQATENVIRELLAVS